MNQLALNATNETPAEEAPNQEVLAPSGQIREYDPFRQELIQLKEENKKLAFDYFSEEGNKEARSYVYKLRRSKTAVDEKRKDATKDLRDRIGLINEEGNALIAEIQEMIDHHQEGIEAAAKKEEERVQTLKDRVADLTVPEAELAGWTLDKLRNSRMDIQKIPVDETFSEYQQAAERAKFKSLEALNNQIKVVEERLRNEQELEKMRKDKDIDERISKLRSAPVDLIGKDSASIKAAVDQMIGMEFTAPLFGDRIEEARNTHTTVMDALKKMLEMATESEERAARDKAEAEEKALLAKLEEENAMTGSEISGGVIGEAVGLPEDYPEETHVKTGTARPTPQEPVNSGVPLRFAPQPAANDPSSNGMVDRAEDRWSAAQKAVVDYLVKYGFDIEIAEDLTHRIASGDVPHLHLKG